MGFFEKIEPAATRLLVGRVKQVLEMDSRHASALLGAMGEKNALRLIKRAEKETSNLKRRQQYVQAGIERARRIADLEKWLEDNPDPADILDTEEIRAIPHEEFNAYYRKWAKVDNELEVLRGFRSGTWLLGQRLGQDIALDALMKLFKVFDISTSYGKKRINAIAIAASKSGIKYPLRYIQKSIDQEREDDDED